MDSEAGAELSFVRLDVEAGRKAPGFDPVALQLCRNSVRADWRPCLKHAKLAGRDADASWRYRNQVFHPRMSFPGGDDYVRGSLLLVVSGRAELTIEGQTIVLEPMNSWVVPKGAEHSYRILEEFTAVEATSPPAEVHGRDEG